MAKEIDVVIPGGMKIEDFQEVLHCLAISGFPEQQIAAAAHPFAAEKTLLWIAENATYWGSYGIGPLNSMAERKDLAGEVMLALLNNEHYPRSNFLNGEMLTPVVAVNLFELEDGLYHSKMASSDKVPREVLCVLAEKAYFPAIQEMAGESPLFDQEIMDIILKRSDIDERRLPGNPETKRLWVYLALAYNNKITMSEEWQIRFIEGKKIRHKSHLWRLSQRKDLTLRSRKMLDDLGIKSPKKAVST
jgi:hypothetical protein